MDYCEAISDEEDDAEDDPDDSDYLPSQECKDSSASFFNPNSQKLEVCSWFYFCKSYTFNYFNMATGILLFLGQYRIAKSYCVYSSSAGALHYVSHRGLWCCD